MHRTTSKIIISVFVLSLLVIFFSPVASLVIKEKDSLLLFLPLRGGQKIQTGYTHSVQLTPVEDDYKIIGDDIWHWEERVVSHNAGLPVDAPGKGRFFQDESWMYFQGGRYFYDRFYLRVGDEDLGRNWLEIYPGRRVELFKNYPLSLLEFSVARQPLLISMLKSDNAILQKGKSNNTIDE